MRPSSIDLDDPTPAYLKEAPSEIMAPPPIDLDAPTPAFLKTPSSEIAAPPSINLDDPVTPVTKISKDFDNFLDDDNTTYI
mmetsp:Transcript_16061/g.18156  ORF Transcript_16061/g.18156 Transcript_16061/m.18156 type:complete len:81 (-) Transcript_16061:95-337(-)